MSDALLIFIDPHNKIEGWLQVIDDEVVARGPELEGLPDLSDRADGDPVRVAAIVPGEAVAMHWLELPTGLAPAQAAAAARIVAADVSAQPMSDMHVAVGPEGDEGALRAVAMVPALNMAGWLGQLQARAIDPDLVLPEPLLLRSPDVGYARHDRGGPLPLYRGATDAFSVEPELAELIVANAPVETLADDAFEGGLSRAIADPVLNLRQGAFAKRRRWQIEWALVRRLAFLTLAVIAATLAIQVAAIFRYTLEADTLEMEANRVAATALQRTGPVNDGPRQLEQRLSDLRGGGPGYAALATGVFDAVRGTPDVELTALEFDQTGALRATVQAASAAAIATLQQRIEASGFTVIASEARSGGGRPTIDLTVRAP